MRQNRAYSLLTVTQTLTRQKKTREESVEIGVPGGGNDTLMKNRGEIKGEKI